MNGCTFWEKYFISKCSILENDYEHKLSYTLLKKCESEHHIKNIFWERGNYIFTYDHVLRINLGICSFSGIFVILI